MKYYSIAEIEITDSKWVREYVRNVTPMVEAHGGRYLTRTSQIDKLEGERKIPGVFLIIEWPSREAALTFYESEEYRPYRERRWKGAKNEFILVPSEDMTKTAKISP